MTKYQFQVGEVLGRFDLKAKFGLARYFTTEGLQPLSLIDALQLSSNCDFHSVKPVYHILIHRNLYSRPTNDEHANTNPALLDIPIFEQYS